jgi:di/tricarboxylate transporter
LGLNERPSDRKTAPCHLTSRSPVLETALFRSSLEVSVDPFLMAVAVGSASAYLTPIGHQSNTLVMGPGVYRFGDYTRVGIGLEAIILLVGVPMVMLVWPPVKTAFGP